MTCDDKFDNQPNFNARFDHGSVAREAITVTREQIETALVETLRVLWATRRHLRADGSEIIGTVFMPDVVETVTIVPSTQECEDGACFYADELWRQLVHLPVDSRADRPA